MSILEAANQLTIKAAALAYCEAGLSVIPCGGKQANIQWSRWQTERATFGRVHYWHTWGVLSNIGIVCGRVSNLVVIDLDGLEAVADFEATFPHLLDTLTVSTGSRKGKHYWYYAPIGYSTETIRTKGFEVRGDGCYVIAPPSIHPISGLPYMVNGFAEPASLELTDVRRWVKAKMLPKPTPRPVIKTHNPAITGIRNPTGYALSALQDECRVVRAALEGKRNDTLYLAAVKMGSFVGMGWLDQWVAEKELAGAAASLSASDGEAATMRTIASGLKDGAAGDRTAYQLGGVK